MAIFGVERVGNVRARKAVGPVVNAPFFTVAGMPREALGHACGGPAAPQSVGLPCAASCKLASGTWWKPRWKTMASTMLLSVALLAGPWRARTAGVLAETHVAPIVCRSRFASGFQASNRSGSARSSGTEVMPKAVSSLVSPVFRSVRSVSGTLAEPCRRRACAAIGRASMRP